MISNLQAIPFPHFPVAMQNKVNLSWFSKHCCGVREMINFADGVIGWWVSEEERFDHSNLVKAKFNVL